MKPEISLELISQALGGVLSAEFPESTVYDNPNQQNTSLPAFFINFMPGSGIAKQIGNRYMRTLRIDLVYLEDYNLPDLYDRYKHAAELLDEKLELIKYNCSYEDPDTGGLVELQCLLRTFDRQWRVELSALHYEFRMELRVSIKLPQIPKMEVIEELSEKIK